MKVYYQGKLVVGDFIFNLDYQEKYDSLGAWKRLDWIVKNLQSNPSNIGIIWIKGRPGSYTLHLHEDPMRNIAKLSDSMAYYLNKYKDVQSSSLIQPPKMKPRFRIRCQQQQQKT